MNQGIVVVTWSGGKNWAELCLKSLESLKERLPIYIVINDAPNANRVWINSLIPRYNVIEVGGDFRELGALKCIIERTDLDEFWLFQDSIEITDPSFIIESFYYDRISFSYSKNTFQYYIGKWRRDTLKMIEIPLPKTKLDAIGYEFRFGNFYRSLETGIYIVDSDFDHENRETNYLETLFGEERLTVVGKYLNKRVSLAPENMIKMERVQLTSEEIEQWKESYRK
jgi:hypothetical protein